MEWYSALCHHLLNNEPIQSTREKDTPQIIQLQLEKKVVDLYKAIFLYQMKSVCIYYKNQGLVFLQGLSNWNDWDGLLKNVTEAQQVLEKD
jgi:hypothetical protein